MTPIERTALHEMIDAEVREALAAQKAARQVMRAIVPRPREPRTLNRCVYCGGRCVGRACRGHRDLIQIETAAIT